MIFITHAYMRVNCLACFLEKVRKLKWLLHVYVSCRCGHDFLHIVVTPYIQSFKEILVNYTHSKNQNQEKNLL